MRVPEFDHRGRDEILKAIAKNAHSYTPEWRFDRENPDFGAALANIYAELFSQTIRRYNRAAEKNMAAFLNSMDARLLPAIPAEGYVRFGLAGDVPEGAEVPAGTPLLADADNETGSTVFETSDDVLVTPAEPEQIFTACGSMDAIVRCYDRERTGEDPFYLFDLQGENLQRHTICFGNEALLELSSGAEIAVELIPGHQRELSSDITDILTNPLKAVWEYSCGSSWQPFATCRAEGNFIRLSIGKHQLPVEPVESEDLENRRLIRLRLRKGTKIPPISLRLIRLSAQNQKLLPNLVHASGADQNIREFFPFGEQPGVFSEVYFGCGEALVKRGADIEMSFRLQYLPVPVDLMPEAPPINWKLVMKKSDFRIDKEADITIAEVLWEYYNGSGWARLFPDNQASTCFTPGPDAATEDKLLRFTCPEDIEPVLVNAETGYFIRARILKINNLYKLKGKYIVPFVEGLEFAYSYKGRGRLPEAVFTENNRETERIDPAYFRGGDASVVPFRFLEEDQTALYLGFPTAPLGGPIKILFLLAETLREKPGRLRWEYRTERGWETLNVVDETENLRQSGILTIMGSGEFYKARLWGQDYYWIRAVDEEGRYMAAGKTVQLPRITGFYMNTVRVRNIAKQPAERFYIEPEQKNFVCTLLQQKVNTAEVWVNEMETIQPGELDRLEREERLHPVRDQAGILTEAWVRWEEQEDFALSGPEDRHYILDRNEGKIQFSDGIAGKIPPAGKQETIEIFYSSGGGQIGNVEPGAINRSSRSLGFVSKVENPRATAGGCDQETFIQAVARGGAALRHGSRAVTASDFEALALEATRNIALARCFTNCDDFGTHRPGWVTLVVVLRDYQAGGNLLATVKKQVLDYIISRCGGNLAALEHFHVIPPQFLELSVKAELTVSDFNRVFSVREELQKRLDAFLDPLTGNFDGKGWEVGRIPNDTQLRNCLSGVPGVRFLKNVSATAFMETGFGRTEVSPEDLKKQVFALPKSGKHNIIISVE